MAFLFDEAGLGIYYGMLCCPHACSYPTAGITRTRYPYQSLAGGRYHAYVSTLQKALSGLHVPIRKKDLAVFSQDWFNGNDADSSRD